MNKADTIAEVNGFITAVVDITEHRDSMLTLINQLFPTVVNDSQSTETYTTKAGTNLNYSITIHKSGNSCHIKGSITNNTLFSQTSQNVFTWKTNEYKPKSGVNDFTFRAINGANSVNLFLNNSVLALSTSIPASSTYTFEYQFYIAQD